MFVSLAVLALSWRTCGWVGCTSGWARPGHFHELRNRSSEASSSQPHSHFGKIALARYTLATINRTGWIRFPQSAQKEGA